MTWSCVAQEAYQQQQPSAGASGKSGLTISVGGSSPDDPANGGAPAEASGNASACSSSRDCAPPTPYCLPSTGVCVECVTQRNCGGSVQAYCDTTSNTCVECLLDENCTKLAPYCSTSLGLCVECLSSANCGDPGLTCDRLNYRCVETCQHNEDCAGTPQTPYCDPGRSLCVSCLGDVDCPTNLPHCEPDTNTCVGCVADGDCPANARRCDPHAHACVACLTNRDCQTGATCRTGACVETK